MGKFVTPDMLRFLGHLGWISAIGLPVYFLVDSWLINTCHFTLLKQPTVNHFFIIPFIVASVIAYFYALKLFGVPAWIWKPGLLVLVGGLGWIGWKMAGLFIQFFFN